MKTTIKSSFQISQNVKEAFLMEVKATRSADTFRQYELAIRRFESYFPIKDISSLTVSQFTNELNKTGIAPASVNTYLRGLRVYVNWAGEQGYIKPFKIKMVKGQEEEFKCYTNAEISKLLKKPPKNAAFGEYRQWVITNWVLATGNRAATIRNIKMKDIDFENEEIHINTQKNKRYNIIPLSPTLAAALKEYIRIWRYAAEEEDYLFCDATEQQLKAEGLTRATARYNKARGVNNTSIHSLRHTFARNYLLNGGNIFKLQRILGHSTLDMTRRYANLICEDLKDDFAALSPLDNFTTQRIKRA